MQTPTLFALLIGFVMAGVAVALRTVAYRLSRPAGEPVRRCCHRCGLPVRSGGRGWLPTTDRCAACHVRRGGPGWLYAGTGAAAAAVLLWRSPIGDPSDALHLAGWLAFALGGILLAGIDIAVHRLPTAVIGVVAIVSGGLLGAAAIAAGRPADIGTALLAGAAVGGLYLLLAVSAPGQLGLGDVRLAALVGLVLGATSWSAALLGAALPYVLAIPFALARLRLPKGSAGRRIALGPFLIAGAVLAVLVMG